MGFFIVNNLKTWPKREEDGIQMYQALDTFLKKGHKKNTRRFSRAIVIERAKTLDQKDCIVVWLWKTPIMNFRLDGEFTLHSGGYRTVATKLVMESFLPKGWGLWQANGVWKISRQKLKEDGIFCPKAYRAIFYDGISLPSEFFSNFNKQSKELARIKQTRAQIRNFVAKLKKMLDKGTLQDPGPGDCFICQSKEWSEADPSHILLHLEQKYVVPSLVWNALIEVCGEKAAHYYWYFYSQKRDGKDAHFDNKDRFLSAVTAYLKKHTAIAR